MSSQVSLKSRTPAMQIGATFYAVWIFSVALDAGAAAGLTQLRLGLASDIPLEDPARHPQIAALAGTSLVKAPGATLQYVARTIAGSGEQEIAFLAPAESSELTPIFLFGLDADGGERSLAYAASAGGTENAVQVFLGPVTGSGTKAGSAEPVLPYANEPFGVYQPLIGWRSQLAHSRLSRAIARRIDDATRLVERYSSLDREQPVGTVRVPRFTDRTNTKIGQRLAAMAADSRYGPIEILREGGDRMADTTREVLENVESRFRHGNAQEGRMAAPENLANLEEQLSRESRVATTLNFLAQRSPGVINELFRSGVSNFDRVVAGASLFADPSPAKAAFLSPIGILHLFREYFFQLGTFLGPPVGHVWLSPGGTVELLEVNTNRVLTERLVEQSTETVTKSENDQSDKEELSDAVKTENANDMKLGVQASASGGITGIFQASGSASFNLDISRKQAQEQAHKKMREQSAKLSTEVRQNFKTTFRTLTETTDTSSRRYILQNTSDRLVSYELSRKMRKVAVQVQDLGRRLCWQLYIDNPGDPLGIGEFVHATGEALDPALKEPNKKAYPANVQNTFSAAIPFILYQGGDDDAEDTYVTSGANADHGIFSPDVGKDDIIQFTFPFKCPPAPPGFVLSQIQNLDFAGAQVKWAPDLQVNAAAETFTIRLKYANFGGRKQLPFSVTLVYEPTDAIKTAIDQGNAQVKAEYQDQLEAGKEKQFYDTLRTRLKLVGHVKSRSPEDLREEERSIVYRVLISKLYGKTSGWSHEDYHVASEMIRYFFDVDAMLYFVAPDWWRPRYQELASMNDKGELQPTVISEPAMSTRVLPIGGKIAVIPGHRPYYMITEETQPAPMGSSLGWLIQLDGDTHRNAFLNSPWVKTVLPIRPGRERDAITFLERPEVAGTDGLDEPYPFDAASDPPEYAGKALRDVLLMIADKIAAEYLSSLTPEKIDPADVNSAMALPTETVFAHGFNPLDKGIAFGAQPFRIFSQWTEVLPTDQVVATEYAPTS